ncbi:MAG TPA: mechanosensitive ion channel domain-containing protein [Steroidobacteraceae bacterium]|nr:mechanosensitive ion channel domain-containing protein [Steroidobacteraceae bacterium]
MKRLKPTEKILFAVLGALLLLAGVTWWQTAPPAPQAVNLKTAAITSADLVDQSTYATAQRLALFTLAPEELNYGQSALRVADHELDLAFTEALRDVEAHPPALNAQAAAIQGRINKSQALSTADQQRVNELTAALAQAKAGQKDKLQDQLDLVQSQLELDKDELDEANQNLTEAGGNPRQRIEAMVQEHDAQTKSHPTTLAAKTATTQNQQGSIGKFRDWRGIRQKQQQLDEARSRAQQKARALSERHATLATGLESTKGSIPELARHTKAAKDAATPSAPVQQELQTHEDAATLVGRTKAIVADQTILTLINKRIADQNQLARVYDQWSSLVALQSRVLAHDMLLDALIVIGVLILVLLLDTWLQRLLDGPKLDRRQVETLRSITRVSLRVVAVLIILLIVLGMPSQFATTIGIVGAGLTVALKDFIVAFFGWLVLMGRNGIRLGDWVEINGVSGEVTELGMFHTVLLETGNWSDSGHPTGRRVTFTNSFAIEGHYFNFSTSGQWLWDELQLVVPIGRDPYPIVDSITKQVVEATADSSRQAEQEWQRAVPAQRGKAFSGTPGVSVKPVVGGVEIAVRYITRANERFMVRAKLYQQAVDLLGAKPPAPAPAQS